MTESSSGDSQVVVGIDEPSEVYNPCENYELACPVAQGSVYGTIL